MAWTKAALIVTLSALAVIGTFHYGMSVQGMNHRSELVQKSSFNEVHQLQQMLTSQEKELSHLTHAYDKITAKAPKAAQAPKAKAAPESVNEAPKAAPSRAHTHKVKMANKAVAAEANMIKEHAKVHAQEHKAAPVAPKSHLAASSPRHVGAGSTVVTGLTTLLLAVFAVFLVL
mmetsp:Transcript_7202/g.16430  ORF Transcript_7202/g.16430 Transcript_7202/m.16430 type:complete len:174 (-) Transcript_7202:236-757(-)